ncbi:MAG: hypothetical protein P4N60_11215 [Verrucomicrobiae bacterium]|nr:hypothetical protein [Verrucomicrobiae bacterium]
MADKKSLPGFAGHEPEKIDHLNPPKPNKPEQSSPKPADHTRRERPEALAAPKVEPKKTPAN